MYEKFVKRPWNQKIAIKIARFYFFRIVHENAKKVHQIFNYFQWKKSEFFYFFCAKNFLFRDNFISRKNFIFFHEIVYLFFCSISGPPARKVDGDARGTNINQ